MPSFDRYIGIDYSGAQTPTSSLSGLQTEQNHRRNPDSTGGSKKNVPQYGGGG